MVNSAMPDKIDFSQSTRGQFFKAGMQISTPIYLDAKLQTELASIALAKGIDISVLANDLLKKDLELIQLAR
jgi:hypothetical protein